MQLLRSIIQVLDLTGKKAFRMNRTLPLILTLDTHGVPHRWITWQQAVWYYAKERVAWELGQHAFTVYGGRSHLTGEPSRQNPHCIHH